LETSKKYAIAFVAFIIAIMVFSSLVVFFNDNSQTPPSNPNPQNPNQPSVPAVEFQSVEFDALVSDVFPQLIIVGQTKEYNIAGIESEIAKVQGFRSFTSSSYAGTNPQDLSYKAEILLLPGSQPSDFFSLLSQNSRLLTGLQGFAVGLVELPSEIEVSNPDLNISKKFIPPQQLSQAFISLSTLKGDSIKAVLNVSLANETPSNLQVFDCSFVSQPKQFSEKISAVVSFLEKKLLVQGSMSPSAYIDENVLKLALTSPEFSIESIAVMPFDINNPSSFFLDLNLSSENSRPAFEFLQAFFTSKSIEFSAVQPLSIEISSIFIKDLNKTFALDSNSLSIQAKPGHSLSDAIDLNIGLIVQCGKILQAQGSE
jgi:hypothetical protein